jgi:hypothetical protein
VKFKSRNRYNKTDFVRYNKYLYLDILIELGEEYLTTIPVKKELLEELVDLKLKFLYDEIDKVLVKWSYESPTKFLNDVKNGTLGEAENDAITLRHLLDQREELFNLKSDWNMSE